MAAWKNKLLTVLSETEQYALYGLPDFDDAQRQEYLALSETELALASSRPGLHAQIYCVLQIGYFKAKQTFFRFDWNEVEDDCAFVLSHYFHGETFERKLITKYEHYIQRDRVAALAWAKSVFAKQQRLSQRPLAECPAATLPKRLRPYLLTYDADGEPTGLHADHYEFWLYRQIRKRFKSDEIYLNDSLQHRHFSDELVSMDEKADVLAQMDIPFLSKPIEVHLDALTAELRTQWLAFNREIKQGKLTHLEYDRDTQKLTWRKPKGESWKARYSRKYFGRGKGVFAYTLLCNHVPLNGYLIGAHEYEGHHVFDIWYRNTSDIVPTVITGDMHSVNKANFAILH